MNYSRDKILHRKNDKVINTALVNGYNNNDNDNLNICLTIPKYIQRRGIFHNILII